MVPIGQLLLPIALMIILIIAGMVVFVWIRRRYLDDQPADEVPRLTALQIVPSHEVTDLPREIERRRGL